MSNWRVKKDDEIYACMWAPVSEETKCVTVGSFPFFPLGAPDSIESDDLVLIGCASFNRSHFLIKSSLNSYRAGAHFNLVTRDVSALFSEQ